MKSNHSAAAILMDASKKESLVEVLQRRAALSPNKVAITFLAEGSEHPIQVTYGQLDKKAKIIAAKLQETGASEERVLLFYPQGIEFVEAFFGCLYARGVAVPAYPPKPGRSLGRIAAIISQCQASYVLTTSNILAAAESQLTHEPSMQKIHWLSTNTLPESGASRWQHCQPSPASLAFLQYTSGSTSLPKGVMVTHANIVANAEMIRIAFQHEESSTMVSWLPLFHDMGLIGNLLQQIYVGAPVVLFSPTAFLEQPLRWLSAISKYRANTSGAPNFAYELCAKKITESEKKNLDLSSWKVAYNGSELVRKDTLERFALAFESCGFRRDAFLPCYGLAEATLLVAGHRRNAFPRSLELDLAMLETGKVQVGATNGRSTRASISCGAPTTDSSVIIVNPDTFRPCASNEIGEIWVSGPHVAQGYWNRPDETRESFEAKLSGSSSENYLRTGDLGFLDEGELFITGRMKDMVIIRGRNVYPDDVERTLEKASQWIKPSRCAAFSVEREGEEILAVVIEADAETAKVLAENSSPYNASQPTVVNLVSQLQNAVVTEFDIPLKTIAIIKPGTIPRTSSGKIQRTACRKGLLDNKLDLLFVTGFRQESLTSDSPTAQSKVAPASSSGKPEFSSPRAISAGPCDEMLTWIRDYAERRIDSRIFDERRTISPHIVLDFGNRGLMGLQVPKNYGGLEFSAVDTMRVLEQLGAIDISLALMVGSHNILGTHPLLKFGRPDQKNRWLPHLATGRQLASFAITEPAGGSNPNAIEGRATQRGPAWEVQCQKSWIGLASWAGLITFIVKAQSIDGKSLGSIAFAVEQGAKGLRHGGEALTMGVRGIIQNTVHLEKALIPDENRIDEIGKGFQVAFQTMGFARLGVAAASVGVMRRCAQLLARYASRRHISTGSLIDNPVTLSRLSEIISAACASEALVMGIARAVDDGANVSPEAFLVCKATAPELAFASADMLMQNLGGRGYIETNTVPQIFRDSRLLRIFEGPTETMLTHLGSNLMHGTQSFSSMLQGIFGAGRIADEIAEDAKSVKETMFNADASDLAASGNWAHYQLGRLASAAALLAAAKQAHEKNASEETEVSVEWAERRLKELRGAMQTALRSKPGKLAKGRLLSVVEKYRGHIGDIELGGAGEERMIDPLLKRNGEMGAPAVEAPPRAVLPPVIDLKPNRDIRTVIHKIVLDWMRTEMNFKEDTLDPNVAFPNLGIDSFGVASIAAEIEKALGMTLRPELIFECQTINALTRYLESSR